MDEIKIGFSRNGWQQGYKIEGSIKQEKEMLQIRARFDAMIDQDISKGRQKPEFIAQHSRRSKSKAVAANEKATDGQPQTETKPKKIVLRGV